MEVLKAGIFESFVIFFQSIQGGLSLNGLFYLFIGLEILSIIIFLFIVNNVYEFRLVKAIDKINAYLYEVQYINENNLIEFNNLMKRVPKVLRYHWQQYMLNRDNNPSYYMSVKNCVDRPIKSSSYSTNIKVIKIIGIIFAGLSFLFSCGWVSSLPELGPDYLITIFLIPVIILVINYLFIMYLSVRRTNNLNELYQTFQIFNRFIDKAVSTMPDYVDFEVLFTSEEIKRGIPVLNEYIEKRQLQEQEEMKKARENAVQHEQYNFKEVGEKGELVLERAMKETEVYFSTRNRLTVEIETFEREIESLKRNFENTIKDYQKQLQASSENIQRLREQQESTTNKIEYNYAKKQQIDEVKKQEQIEKKKKDEELRFNQEINNLTEEINKRKVELETAKSYVSKAMMAEYKTFADKVYAEIKEDVIKNTKQEFEDLINQREDIAKELEITLSKMDNLEKVNKNLIKQNQEREISIKQATEEETNQLKQQLKKIDNIINNKPEEKTTLSSKEIKNLSNKSKKHKQNYEILTGEFEFDNKNVEIENSQNEEIKLAQNSENNINNEFINNKDSLDEVNIAKPKLNSDNLDINSKLSGVNDSIIDKKDNLTISSENIVSENNLVDKTKKDYIEEKETFDENDLFDLFDSDNKTTYFELKGKSEEDDDDDDTEGKKKVNTEIKKVGRPKKAKKTIESKKRGRPTKVELNENVVKKGRGRPRKKVINIDENLKSIEIRLKEQNELLKQQQKALDITLKNIIKPK